MKKFTNTPIDFSSRIVYNICDRGDEVARINYFERVLARIEDLSAGEVFIISDFSDIADTTVVRKVLSRLEEDGRIPAHHARRV